MESETNLVEYTETSSVNISSEDRRRNKAERRMRHARRGAHQLAAKLRASRKRPHAAPKFFLPHKRVRKDAFIPPTKFLLGGNISDPLNLNSLQDEDVNRAMNAVTPRSSPLPTPPRHRAKVDVIIPPDVRDPLNLLQPLSDDEYEKRLERSARRTRKRTKPLAPPPSPPASPPPPRPDARHKEGKRLRRVDSMDKIVSPVVPQPGAWKRVRQPQPRDRSPASPPRPPGPAFHPKNQRYQYGNYDRYYGYRGVGARDVRLEVLQQYRHVFAHKDVLDVGCNVGYVSIAVARLLGARSVTGLDIDHSLIERARRNLQAFISVPEECSTLVPAPAPAPCERCLVVGCSCAPSRTIAKKCKRRKKNRKNSQQNELYFPASFSTLYGPLLGPQMPHLRPVASLPSPAVTPSPASPVAPSLASTVAPSLASPVAPPSAALVTPTPAPTAFPNNVTFKQGNYVSREESWESSGGLYDVVLCLSTTKWLHLNFGDAGLKLAFRRMFAELRPGGKLVLEPQSWSSYARRKTLTERIYNNYKSLELLPHKFRDYLLSPEVGFSRCSVMGVPRHRSKGFRRPLHLYVKGDFTPSGARWSDAYAPPSSHRAAPSPPATRRTVYAPCAPRTPRTPHRALPSPPQAACPPPAPHHACTPTH